MSIFVRPAIFVNQVIAEHILFYLKCLLKAHGSVTIADYYKLVGIKSGVTDTDFGWTNLDDIFLLLTETGWKIQLPNEKRLYHFDGNTCEEKKPMGKISEARFIVEEANRIQEKRNKYAKMQRVVVSGNGPISIYPGDELYTEVQQVLETYLTNCIFKATEDLEELNK